MLKSLLVLFLGASCVTGQGATCPPNSYDIQYRLTSTSYQPIYPKSVTPPAPDPVIAHNVGPFAHDEFLTGYPAGIGASTQLVVSADGRSMYMGTTNGGVWKSDNFHQPHPGFRPLTDHMFCASVSTVAVSPSNWNYVAAGCGSKSNYYSSAAELRGVLLSKDGGATWTETAFGSGRRIDALTILPPSSASSNATIVVASAFRRYKVVTGEYLLGSSLSTLERRSYNLGPQGSEGGLWVSNDDGLTWKQTFPRAVRTVQRDPVNPNNLYMITHSSYTGAWFYRSTDRGQTWTPFNDGMLLNTVAWEYEPQEYNDTYNFQDWPATGYGFPNRTHTIPAVRPPLVQDIAFQPRLPFGIAENLGGAANDDDGEKERDEGDEHSKLRIHERERRRRALLRQGLSTANLDDDDEQEWNDMEEVESEIQQSSSSSSSSSSSVVSAARRRLLQTAYTTTKPTSTPTPTVSTATSTPTNSSPTATPTSAPRFPPDPSGRVGSSRIMWPRYVDNAVIDIYNKDGLTIVYMGVWLYNDLPATDYIYDFYYSVNGAPWIQFSDPFLDYENVISLDGQGQTNFYLTADPIHPYIVYIGGTGTGRARVDVRTSSYEQDAWTWIAHSVFTEDGFERAVNNSLGIYAPHADARYAFYDVALDRIVETNDGGLAILSHPYTSPANGKWIYVNGNYSTSEFMSVAYDWRSGTIGGGAQDNGIYISKPYTTEGDYYSLSSGDGEQVVFDTSHPSLPARGFSTSQNMGGFSWVYLNDTITDENEMDLANPFDFSLMATSISYVLIETRQYAPCNATYNMGATYNNVTNITTCYRPTLTRRLIPHDRMGINNETHRYFYLPITATSRSRYWTFTTYFAMNRINSNLFMACSISLTPYPRPTSILAPDTSMVRSGVNILSSYNACHRMSFGIYNKITDESTGQVTQVMKGSLGNYTRDANGVVIGVTDYVFTNYEYGGRYNDTPYESFVLAAGNRYIWLHDPFSDQDITIQAPWYVAGITRQMIKDLTSNPNNLFHAYLTLSNGTILHTRDMGMTWIDITNNLFILTGCQEHPYSFGLTMVPINGTDISAVVVGTAFGLYYSFDHIMGNNSIPVYNWASLGTNFPNTLVSRMVYSPQADALIVGTMGRGFWRLDRVQQYLADILNGCYALTIPQPIPARNAPFIPVDPRKLPVISSTAVAPSSTGVASSSIPHIPSSSSSSVIIIRYTFTIYFRLPLGFISTKIIQQLIQELSRILNCSPSIIVILIIINGRPLNVHPFHTLADSTNTDVTPTPIQISFQPATSAASETMEVTQAASNFRSALSDAQEAQAQNKPTKFSSSDADSVLASMILQGIQEEQGTPFQDTQLCPDGTQRFTSETCPTSSSAPPSSSSSFWDLTRIVIVAACAVGVLVIVIIILLCVRHSRRQTDFKAEKQLDEIAMQKIEGHNISGAVGVQNESQFPSLTVAKGSTPSEGGWVTPRDHTSQDRV